MWTFLRFLMRPHYRRFYRRQYARVLKEFGACRRLMMAPQDTNASLAPEASAVWEQDARDRASQQAFEDYQAGLKVIRARGNAVLH